MAVTAADTVWEVWPTGNDLNGGGFSATFKGATGIDRSQQAGAFITCTGNLSTAAAGSVTLNCSAALFDSSVVGNLIQITAGTGFSAGFYMITSFVSATSVTLSISATPSAVGSGGTGRIGGALATMTKPVPIAGNWIWVKDPGTGYNVSAAQNFAVVGTNVAPITYAGYTATRGDNGIAAFNRTTGNFNLISNTGAFKRFLNFRANAFAGAAVTKCFVTSGNATVFQNCIADGGTVAGFELGSGANNAILVGCLALRCTSTAAGAFSILASGISGVVFLGCWATQNACPGYTNLSTASRILISRSIASKGQNTAPGIRQAGAGTSQLMVDGCVLYGNDGDGLLIDTTTAAATGDGVVVVNSIFSENGGYDINCNGVALGDPFLDWNAFYSTGSGRYNNLPAGSHDVVLSASPFVDAAGDFYSLIDTGAGAACRAAGFPGVLPNGEIGYLDIGAIQHADPTSGGGGGGAGAVLSRVRTGY